MKAQTAGGSRVDPPTPAQHHRFYFLDALRGLAAILIVFWHLPPGILPRGNTSSYLAVDFFYCLSGFVIAFSYEQRLATSLSLRGFLAARAIRLYPTYLLGALLGTAMLVLAHLQMVRNPHFPLTLPVILIAALLMIPNGNLLRSALLYPAEGPAWSLVYEVLVNILYGWMVRKAWASTRVCAAIMLVAFGLLVCAVLSHGNLNVGYRYEPASWFAIPRVILPFLSGVLILRLFRRLPLRRLRTPLNTAVIAFVLAGLVLCLLTPFALLRTKTALLLTVSLLFPGFVFLGSLVHIPLRTVGLCVFLGDVSYPLYLLHHLLIDTFDVPAVLARAQLHPLLAVAAVAIGSLVLAQIVLVFYDVPVRRILTQSYKRRTTPRLVIS